MEISCSVCENQYSDECVDCCNDDSDMYIKFESSFIIEQLRVAQETIDTLVTAIKGHKDASKEFELETHDKDLYKTLDDLGLS